jgi:hypothetical protein
MHGLHRGIPARDQGGNRSRPGQRAFTLHYGSSKTALATVLPHPRLPGMFVVQWPDGTISDFGNFSRVRDAAFTAAARGRDWRSLNWRIAPLGEAQRKPSVSFPVDRAPTVPGQPAIGCVADSQSI